MIQFDDIDSYKLMVTNIKEHNENKCNLIIPLAKETIFPKIQLHTKKIPSTFRFKQNYKTKLENETCNSVYSQYNTLAMNEFHYQHKIIKPKYTIAPMKTNISFLTNNHIKPISITRKDFNKIEQDLYNLPFYFNWMDNSNFMSKPFNQGLCGSCWAVAAANCLSDVFVVSKKVATNPNLSPTYLLSCYPQGQCNGGDPAEVVHDMTNYGISTTECMDYSWCENSGCSGDPLKHFDENNLNQHIPPCNCKLNNNNVINVDNFIKYFASEPVSICIPPNLKEFNANEISDIRYYLSNLYGQLDDNNDDNNIDLSKKSYQEIQNFIKYHIYNFGPVIGGFHVFKNFFKGNFSETNDIYIETYTYRGIPGINYDDVERDWVGSHAVVIVGWGIDKVKNEDVSYWIVRNSWGTNWGKSGFFKMAMYGNDPNKKYQNRISQFEYPSIVNIDNQIGITGGIIMMKAGDIINNNNSNNIPDNSNNIPDNSNNTPDNSNNTPDNSNNTPDNSNNNSNNTPDNSNNKNKNNKNHYNNNNDINILSLFIFIIFVYFLYVLFKNKRGVDMIFISQTILIIIILLLLL